MFGRAMHHGRLCLLDDLLVLGLLLLGFLVLGLFLFGLLLLVLLLDLSG